MNLPTNFKERLFGAYMGCEVIYTETTHTLTSRNISTLVISGKLRLKSLSEITDEDAIEVAKIEFPAFENEEFRVTRNSKDRIMVHIFVKGQRVHVVEISFWVIHGDAIDYLRSQSYALPFAGVSVEKQVEAGLIEIV